MISYYNFLHIVSPEESLDDSEGKSGWPDGEKAGEGLESKHACTLMHMSEM